MPPYGVICCIHAIKIAYYANDVVLLVGDTFLPIISDIMGISLEILLRWADENELGVNLKTLNCFPALENTGLRNLKSP